MNKKKSIWVWISLLAAILFSCDFYKQDTSLSDAVKVPYLPHEPVLVSLKSKFNLKSVETYELANSDNSGKIQMINNQFAIYTPGQLSSENVTFRLKDADGRAVGNGRILFEQQENECGIVNFKHAEIDKDSTLHIVLVDQTKICTKMKSGGVAIEQVDDGQVKGIDDGFVIGIYSSHVDLSYTAPKGFVGTDRTIFVVGINVKPGYETKFESLRNAQDYIDNSYIFDFFITTLAEVVVHD